MPAPINTFKKALTQKKRLIGCWLGLADRYAATIMGQAGFDWLLIDGEHAPNDLRSIRDQLAVLAPSASQAVVRIPIGETWIIKQMLDAGAQSILVPMVESAEQARALVRACRFPPKGVRGVGYALAPAAGFGTVTDYGPTADEQICLLVQVESRKGLDALDEIVAVEGIDGVFIGPADLAADLGHLGDLEHDEVRSAVLEAIRRIASADKPAGVLTLDPDMIAQCLAAGATFVAVDVDIHLLLASARRSAAHWKEAAR